MNTMFDEKKEFYFCVFCLQISLSSLHLYHREDFSGIFQVNRHRVHDFPLRAQILDNKYVIYFLRSFFHLYFCSFFYSVPVYKTLLLFKLAKHFSQI